MPTVNAAAPISCPLVVVIREFSLFLLRKHFITEKKLKKKSGDANYEAYFSFLFLLHKRAKPIHPPYIHPSAHLSTHSSTHPSVHPFLRNQPLTLLSAR
jgi:hypothetical protein